MRLITRSDLDGLACAVLLRQVVSIDEVKFAHPKDVQDGKIPVDKNDIITNLPYVEGVGLWFDHHYSESLKHKMENFSGRLEMAPSTARVVANYYGVEKFKKFDDLLIASDKVDSADLTKEEIEKPEGWILLAYIADSRSGLGYYHDFTISNYNLMMKLMDLLENKKIEEILEDKDVKERIKRFLSDQPKFEKLLKEKSWMDGPCVISDFRNNVEIHSGNRFLIYSLFPESNISVRIIDGKNKEFAVIALGHSILNRTSRVNIGRLMALYGGGGHIGAGTCQVAYKDVERVLKEIIDEIKKKEKK